MIDRAISVTVSLRPVELEQLDAYANRKQITRSSAVRELMHQAGIIRMEREDVEKLCEHPRDSIRTNEEPWTCLDCGAVSDDQGETWSSNP